MAELAKTAKWQEHTVRAFISRTVGKQMGLKVVSAKDKDGLRAYRIVG
jgi:hypothetical protein